MGKIRVLSDNLANQIAAGEVVERPASVVKELLENSLDAGATRIAVEIEAGGRRLLKISDDGEGMTRDDAVLAFERHATSKIRRFEDLGEIQTLGFRGEALASIASVARVELTTKTAHETAGTRVQIEGGRLIDVKDAAHPRGTTLAVRELFFNVPARRKFMRSEATENYHLVNLIQHYALARPDIAFTLTNNGRESLRVSPARTSRERAFQVLGGDLLESLLPVEGGREYVARVSGFVSAPRERRTTRDTQYFFINGRFVRDKTLARGLMEGYRSVLPSGVYPVAILFLDVPLEEVDVNVHPAKTEVRFRRAEAIKDVVAEAVRAALASNGFVNLEAEQSEVESSEQMSGEYASESKISNSEFQISNPERDTENFGSSGTTQTVSTEQSRIEFVAPELKAAAPNELAVTFADDAFAARQTIETSNQTNVEGDGVDFTALATQVPPFITDNEGLSGKASSEAADLSQSSTQANGEMRQTPNVVEEWTRANTSRQVLPPLDSAAKIVKSGTVEGTIANNIRPLGQLHNSYIIATDAEGLLLVDQHVAHERILFDKYRRKVGERTVESQNLLLPETFDLTTAQTSAFELVKNELDECGFNLMRLSGRTLAIKAVPADLPPQAARNLLAEILDTVEAEKRGAARDTWRDTVAASLACHAAVKINMPLTTEKMQWLIDNLWKTSSPTTCPHGRPVLLRLTMRDIERSFHRT